MKRTIENIRNEATGSLDDLCQELTGEEGPIIEILILPPF